MPDSRLWWLIVLAFWPVLLWHGLLWLIEKVAQIFMHIWMTARRSLNKITSKE